MKKTGLLLFLIGTMLNAQHTGKVGINIDKPTETLQVNGSVRISELPKNGAINTISTKPDGNASDRKDQEFIAKKTIVADENGVLGYVEGLPSSSSTPIYATDGKFYVNRTIWDGSIIAGDECLQIQAETQQKGALATKHTQVQLKARLNPNLPEKCGQSSYAVFYIRGKMSTIPFEYEIYERITLKTNEWTDLGTSRQTFNSHFMIGSAVLHDLPNSAGHFYDIKVATNDGTYGTNYKPYDIGISVRRDF